MPLSSTLDLYNGTGTATFTRSTTGTYVDKDDGLVKSVAINVARFEKEGVLIEGSSENLLLRSEEFDNASWVKLLLGAAIAPVVTANAGTAPDGTTTADRVQFDIVADDTANRSIIRQNITTSGLNTNSYYVKSNTGANQNIQLHSAGGTSSNFVVTTSWQRIDANATFTGAGFWGLELRGATGSGDTTADILVWGGQVEALPFASSYIPTTTATVTRDADNLSIDAGNIPAPTADYSVSALVDIIGFDPAAFPRIYDVAGESQRHMRFGPTTAVLTGRHGAIVSVDPGATSANTSIRASFVVDSANQTLYKNRAQVDQDVKGTVTGTATSIDLGNRGGGNYLFGHIKDLKIFDVALTQNQVSSL
jgi:hypothetical protein